MARLVNGFGRDAPAVGAARWRALLALAGRAGPVASVLLAAHLAFGLTRVASGAVAKRVRQVQEWHAAGLVDWHFQLGDDETRRIAAWLYERVPADQVVLYDGRSAGYLQLLAAVLFPRLLVHASAHAGGRDAAGRVVFAERPPWLAAPAADAGAGQEGVVAVLGGELSLRLEYR